MTHDAMHDICGDANKQMLKRLNTKFVNTYNRFILTYIGALSLLKGIEVLYKHINETDDCFIETKRNETTDGLRFTETD